MGMAGDATVLRGKYFLSFSTSNTPGALSVLNPTNFGARATAFAAQFSRYRFKYLAIKFFSPVSSGAVTVVGVDDDTATGTAPVTLASVAELRTSATNWSQETVPTELIWKPTSKEWMYCISSGGDQRLVNSGTIYVSATTGSSTQFEFTYSLVFRGAIDTGTN
jgi:hypothetical protein